jgi:hypothetical protein
VINCVLPWGRYFGSSKQVRTPEPLLAQLLDNRTRHRIFRVRPIAGAQPNDHGVGRRRDVKTLPPDAVLDEVPVGENGIPLIAIGDHRIFWEMQHFTLAHKPLPVHVRMRHVLYLVEDSLRNKTLTRELGAARREGHAKAREVAQGRVEPHEAQREAIGRAHVIAVVLHAQLAPETVAELYVQGLVGDPLHRAVHDEGVDGVVFEHLVGRLLALHGPQHVIPVLVALLDIASDAHRLGRRPAVPDLIRIGAGVSLRFVVLGAVEPGGHVQGFHQAHRIPDRALQLFDIIADRPVHIDLSLLLQEGQHGRARDLAAGEQHVLVRRRHGPVALVKHVPALDDDQRIDRQGVEVRVHGQGLTLLVLVRHLADAQIDLVVQLADGAVAPDLSGRVVAGHVHPGILRLVAGKLYLDPVLRRVQKLADLQHLRQRDVVAQVLWIGVDDAVGRGHGPRALGLCQRRPRMEAKPGCPGGNAEQCTPGHECASVKVHRGIGTIIAVVAGGLSDIVFHE